jgi:hypothetical protein
MSAVMMGSFIALMLIGVPIAFAMGAATLLAILAHGGMPFSLLAQRALVGADSYALLAIPFFILAGNLMNYGGITERLINLGNVMVGRFRGGLAQSTVLATMLFSGISGSAVADASALGKVLIPAMKKQGYGAPFSAALMAAASVCGPIIPPSIPMVIYALSVGKGVSIAALFLGGVVPGLMLGLSLMGMAYFISVRRNFPVFDAVPWRELPARALQGPPGDPDPDHHPGRRDRGHRHRHRKRGGCRPLCIDRRAGDLPGPALERHPGHPAPDGTRLRAGDVHHRHGIRVRLPDGDQRPPPDAGHVDLVAVDRSAPDPVGNQRPPAGGGLLHGSDRRDADPAPGPHSGGRNGRRRPHPLRPGRSCSIFAWACSRHRWASCSTSVRNFADVKLEDEIGKSFLFLAMGLLVLLLITIFPELVLWFPRLVLGGA